MTFKQMITNLKSLIEIEEEETKEIEKEIEQLPITEQLANVIISHRDRITIGERMNCPTKFITWDNLMEKLDLVGDPNSYEIVVGHVKIDFVDDKKKEIVEIRILTDPYLQKKLEKNIQKGKFELACKILAEKFNLLAMEI